MAPLDKSRITLRQLLSHTSGLPMTHPALDRREITLAEAVDEIAGAPVIAPPGQVCVYGENDAPLVTNYMPAIARLIETERPPGLRFGIEILPRAGHDPPESLERGLRLMFDTRK